MTFAPGFPNISFLIRYFCERTAQRLWLAGHHRQDGFRRLAHDNGQPHGTIEKVFGDDGYGFIRTVGDDRQFYFHRNSVLHDDFDRLTVGTEVRFTPEQGEKGPQASSVQVVARHSERA